MELPVGALFETIIRWLKTNLGDLFEAIRIAIDFAISLMEQILSVQPGQILPMLVISLAIAAISYGLMLRRARWQVSLPLAVLILGLGLGLNGWRNHRLGETMPAELLGQLRSGMIAMEARLQEAPEEVRSREGVAVGERELQRARIRIERASPGDRQAGILILINYQRLSAFLKTLGDHDGPMASDAVILAKMLKTVHPSPLSWFPWAVTTLLLLLLAWYASGAGLAVFTLLGCGLIQSMGFWEPTTQTLSLVLSATAFALFLGIPLGIASAASPMVDRISKPILDFMQTMPAFVYLIPAVLFFGLGKVPGAIATLIFAMPPAVRLTSLGIRSVPTEVVEAAQSFGSTPMQLLFKAQLPIALPTILAGLNQTIMLALSMVVIGGMIGAGGLGEVVLSGITQLKIGLGFESGLSVVILAIYLDRLTQSIGSFQGKSG
jgi:glycine betaine/proline transport system permease protein